MHRGHCDWLDALFYILTGRLVWIPLYLWLVAIAVRKYGWKECIPCFAGIGIMIFLTDHACSDLLRYTVCRLRPSNPDNPLSELVHTVHGYRGGKYGFPSCHAANTAALTVFIGLWLRKGWITLMLTAWCIGNSYSRIYLGVHYPGDILVGWAVGTGIGYMSWYGCAKASKSGVLKRAYAKISTFI